MTKRERERECVCVCVRIKEELRTIKRLLSRLDDAQTLFELALGGG